MRRGGQLQKLGLPFRTNGRRGWKLGSPCFEQEWKHSEQHPVPRSSGEEGEEQGGEIGWEQPKSERGGESETFPWLALVAIGIGISANVAITMSKEELWTKCAR